jgi:hypothetical protein
MLFVTDWVKMKSCIESWSRGTSYKQEKKGKLTGLVTSCLDLHHKTGFEGKIAGKIEVTRRRERRRKQLLDDLKETI